MIWPASSSAIAVTNATIEDGNVTEYRPLKRNAGPIMVVVFLLVAVIALWVKTELFAAQNGYPRVLGEPLTHVGAFPIYSPLVEAQLLWNHDPRILKISNRVYPTAQLEQFWQHLSDSEIRAYGLWGLSAAAIIALGLAIPYGNMPMSTTGSHGTARWARRREIQRAGLFATGAFVVYLGIYKPNWWTRARYLADAGPEPVIGVAPSRSGKGTGFVVPTLLDWGGSAIVHDTKSDLYRKTGETRGLLGKVYAFAPGFRNSARYNPMDAIPIGTQRDVGEAENMATVIVTAGGDRNDGNHWNDKAIPLLTAGALHVLSTFPAKNLNALAKFFGQDHDQLCEELAASPHPYASAIGLQYNGIAADGKRERSSIISTAQRGLTLYLDPLVAQNTAASDFSFDEFRDIRSPATLYLIAGESDTERFTPLLRLLAAQLLPRLMQDERHQQRILLMLDECATLDVPKLQPALAKIAGYGVKVFMIFQDLNQIYDKYGQYQTIMANARIHAFYAPSEMTTAEYISKALGMQTIAVRSQSRSYSEGKATSNTTHQEKGQELLNPTQVRGLGDRLVLTVSGLEYPILGRKLRYFEDARFADRAGA
jgi:type IV secretion system protein VirD4